MAKKSKTQKAKASAARQARKEQARLEAENPVVVIEQPVEKKKTSITGKVKGFFTADEGEEVKTKRKVDTSKKGKKRFQFFRDVKLEMKRVTWPTRKDVLQWSGVVVCALLFFGIYVALLDNVIITPILVGISSLGA